MRASAARMSQIPRAWVPSERAEVSATGPTPRWPLPATPSGAGFGVAGGRSWDKPEMLPAPASAAPFAAGIGAMTGNRPVAFWAAMSSMMMVLWAAATGSSGGMMTGNSPEAFPAPMIVRAPPSRAGPGAEGADELLADGVRDAGRPWLVVGEGDGPLEVGEGDADWVGLGLEVGVGEADWLGLGLEVADGEADWVGLGLEVGVGEADWVGLALEVGEGVGDADVDAEGAADVFEGDGEADFHGDGEADFDGDDEPVADGLGEPEAAATPFASAGSCAPTNSPETRRPTIARQATTGADVRKRRQTRLDRPAFPASSALSAGSCLLSAGSGMIEAAGWSRNTVISDTRPSYS